MLRSLRGAVLLAVTLAVPPLLGGCDVGEGGGPGARPGPGGPGQGAVEESAPAPGIKRIMVRLTKGPGSLTDKLGKELAEENPPWETIQIQSSEYAREAADLAKFDPPKGTKESWAKLSAAWSESAADLNKAAQAKDKNAAKAAHDQIKSSCMSCHREHRKMGPGMGGPPGLGPGPGGRGGPPGGPAPGGSPPG